MRRFHILTAAALLAVAAARAGAGAAAAPQTFTLSGNGVAVTRTSNATCSRRPRRCPTPTTRSSRPPSPPVRPAGRARRARRSSARCAALKGDPAAPHKDDKEDDRAHQDGAGRAVQGVDRLLRSGADVAEGRRHAGPDQVRAEPGRQGAVPPRHRHRTATRCTARWRSTCGLKGIVPPSTERAECREEKSVAPTRRAIEPEPPARRLPRSSRPPPSRSRRPANRCGFTRRQPRRRPVTTPRIASSRRLGISLAFQGFRDRAPASPSTGQPIIVGPKLRAQIFELVPGRELAADQDQARVGRTAARHRSARRRETRSSIRRGGVRPSLADRAP